MESLLDLLPTYEHLTWSTVGLYVLAGVFGALVRIAWLDKPLRGFYRDKNQGLRMGSYAELVTGIAVAIIVDGHPVRAGIAAIFAPWVLNAMRWVLIERLPAMLEASLGSILEGYNQKKKG